MPDFLKRLASKQNARAAAQLALSLFLDDTKTGPQKRAELAEFLRSNAETLDDAVELIPGIGPVLAALVDSAPVDAVEAQLCDALAEIIVQALKGVQ